MRITAPSRLAAAALAAISFGLADPGSADAQEATGPVEDPAASAEPAAAPALLPEATPVGPPVAAPPDSDRENLAEEEDLRAAIEAQLAESGVEIGEGADHTPALGARSLASGPSPLESQEIREALIKAHRPAPRPLSTDSMVPPTLQRRFQKLRGRLLEELSDFEAARGAYERAIELGQEDCATWRGLGRMRLRTGDLDGAEGALVAALEKRPDLAHVHRELGELYLLAGEPEAAVHALERAVELAPGAVRARGLLERARFEHDPDRPVPQTLWPLWPDPAQTSWRARLERELVGAGNRLPPELRAALTRLGGRTVTPKGQRLALAIAAGLMILLLVGRRLLQGRGDLAIEIDYPAELRGTFSVRLATQRGRFKRSGRIDPNAIRRGAASSSTEHHLVSRETQFRKLRPRTYYVTVEGLLVDPQGEEVLSEAFEEQQVAVARGSTAQLAFGFQPKACPVDVKVVWDKQPARDAVVAARGLPQSIRYARSGPLRLKLGIGSHSIVVGCGDRVAEHEIEIDSFLPRSVEIDLATANILFKGCPPAVEPYLHGELSTAARALEREGLDAEAHGLLARLHRERGQLGRAAEHFELAGCPREAAELLASASSFGRAAELFDRAGDALRAAEMFRSAGEWARAGDAYERALDLETAITCYQEAGETSKWVDALERKGEPFEAARIAIQHDDRARAIRLLQQVAPEDADYPDACTKLSEAYEREGHNEMAAQKLEEYLTVMGPEMTSPDLYSHLAELLERDDECERAIEVLESLRHREPTYPHVATRIEALRKKQSEREITDSRGRASVSAGLATTGFLSEERYELMEEIGRGGMGVVFKAHDKRLNRVVALKRLPDNLRDHPKAIQLFLREAQASARLTHPNITTIYDADQEDGVFFITMELLKGQPLNKILKKRGRLAPRDVARLGMQIAAGLHYAHEQRVVHRDIKTANLFFTMDKTIKIMDFGLAKMMEEVRRAATVVGGTPFYMAPEQAVGEAVDYRADIYAFGVTLFELATGKVPFSKGDVTYHHRHTQPPDPRSLVPEVPAALAELIGQMLEKQVEDRLGSVAVAWEQLREMARG
jgi:tetratricopeptide (TPR) repeat protein